MALLSHTLTLSKNINEHFLPESYCTQCKGLKVRIAQKTSVAAFPYLGPFKKEWFGKVTQK